MDIRIARTDRAIEQAFMELREKNPLEKIKIKDLCAMACINKSTFYAHYEDIYALANALENKLIESILASVPRTNDSGPRSGGGGHSTSTVHMSSGGMYHGGGGRKF